VTVAGQNDFVTSLRKADQFGQLTLCFGNGDPQLPLPFDTCTYKVRGIEIRPRNTAVVRSMVQINTR
jgi:hypothetical protein